MSGLKLQVLSNPSPSFVIGNPQMRVAKNSRKRENKVMSKRRRKPAKHRRRKNPFESLYGRGTERTVVGPYFIQKEIDKDKKSIKYLHEEVRKARREAKAHPGMGTVRRKFLKKKMINMLHQIKLAQKNVKDAGETVKKLKAQGYRHISTKRLSPAEAMKLGIVGRYKGGSSGASKPAASKPAKKASSKKASHKKPKKTSKKKSSKAKSKKASHKKTRAKKGGKGRKSSKKARFGGWRISGREGGFMIMKGPGGKTKRYKIKKRGKAKVKKNPSRKRKARKSHRRHHKHAHRGHRRHRKLKNPRSRRGKAKRHGKRRHHSRRKIRRNPLGGIMGNFVGKLKDASKKAISGGDIGASNIAIAAILSGLVSAGLSKALDMASGGKFSAMGMQAGPVGETVASIPAFIGAVGIEMLSDKVGNSRGRKIGQALGVLAVADLVQGLTSGLSATAMHAVGLSGVSYTPMGRRHPRGMHGVSFTRNHMGAVPRGMGAVPRGLGSYMPSPGGTLSTDADFGALPHGLRGLTHRDNADFGAARQQADFGGVDFTMGAYPSMHGAHTGDVQYQPADDAAGGDDDQTNESNDHTV